MSGASPAAADTHLSRQARVSAEIAAIATMDLAALRVLWSQLIGPPPKLRSVPILRLHLAWRVQAQAFGGLDADARRSLRQRPKKPVGDERLPVGSALSREWLGVAHTVTVEETGYRYGGVTYRTLSQIARQITGARWNGPRFFGLRDSSARKAAR